MNILFLAALFTTGCQTSDDDFSDASGDPEFGERTENTKRHVFVTAATWNGSFVIEKAGGSTEADKLCTTAAHGAGMPGAWIAWFSSHSWTDPFGNRAERTNVKDRVKDVGPWFLVGEDTVVFNNKANLLNTPQVPIDRDEHGEFVANGRVWTGTNVGGNVAFSESCDSWRSSNTSRSGVAGDLEKTTTAWTNAGRIGCEEFAHLYCIQQ